MRVGWLKGLKDEIVRQLCATLQGQMEKLIENGIKLWTTFPKLT